MSQNESDTPSGAEDRRPEGEETSAEDSPPEETVEQAGGIAALEAEAAALKEQLLRALAETENTRRRAERDREDAAKYAVSGFARDVLAVADNLARALGAVPEGAAAEDERLKALCEGVEMTSRELEAALARHGIRRIDPMGEAFDPNLHQAMYEVEDGDRPAGTVVAVMQPGYVIHDRLLRPAMVGVAKKPAEARRVDTSA